MDILRTIQKNPFFLAPMAAITDCPFRSFMREMGCGIVTTELVSATGLTFNSEKTQKLMKYESDQHPIGIQIFGYSLEDLAFAAREIEQTGADFIDLNFGCPVPKVVKKGAGSAVLKDLNKVRDVFRSVKSATSLPVSVKVRTGWDADSINSIEVAQVAYDEGLAWMSIHGRTRAQAYSGEADWDYIKKVKANSKLPIIGNGDVTSAQIAINRLQSTGVDGVMIGRGCLKNPWIFQEAINLYNGKEDKVEKDFIWILHRLKYYLEQHCDERIVMLQLKKLSSWFSSGYPESSSFRKTIFQCKELTELMDALDSYFSGLSKVAQIDTSKEAFLMGGHG